MSEISSIVAQQETVVVDRDAEGEVDEVVVERSVALSKPKRGFAGFSWGEILVWFLICGLAMWCFWLTSQIKSEEKPEIVTVGLSSMVNDFVQTQARSGNGPEQVQRDTARFMSIMEMVLSKRAKAGQTVIVSEAVIAGSAPDITSEVRAEVGKEMMADAPGGFNPAAPGGQ